MELIHDPLTLILLLGLSAALCLSYIFLFHLFPRQVLTLFLLFLLCQWLIIDWLGGQETLLGRLFSYLDEGVILITFSFVTLAALAQKKHIPLNYLILAAGGIILTGTLGGVVNATPVLIVLSDIIIFLKGILIFWIFAGFSYSEKDIRSLLKIIGITAVIILLLAGIELIDPVTFRGMIGNVARVHWRLGFPSLLSIFTHPSIFGWFCGFISLFAFAFYLTEKKIKYLLLFLMFLLGVIFSMRLKPMGAVAAAILSGLICSRSRAKVGVIITVAILGLFLLGMFKTRITGIVREQITEYRDPLMPRTMFYRTSIKIAREYFPLGVGFGRFGGEIAARYYSPVYKKYRFHRIWGLGLDRLFLNDTFWPMILGELGVIGFLIYFGISVYFLLLFKKGYRQATNSLTGAFFLAGFMIFVEALVESLAEPIFVKPPAAYFIFTVAGIAYSLSNRSYRDHENIVG